MTEDACLALRIEQMELVQVKIDRDVFVFGGPGIGWGPGQEHGIPRAKTDVGIRSKPFD